MIRYATSLARDERGASIIELAMAMPVLASLLIGMVDISRAYSAKLQLEQAAYRAVEKVQQYQASESTYTTLQSEAGSAARAAGFSTVADSDVVIDYWLECNGARQANYDTTCPSGQTYARWVTIDIPGTFSPMFSSRRWPGANSNGTFTLHGKAGLRTQ
jgi:Flp pilus assembly protein TadG